MNKDEKENENIVTETPVEIVNDNSDTHKKEGFFSSKKGKKILFGLGAIVLVAIIIVIVIVALKNDNKKQELDDDPIPPPIPHCEECVVDISYKKNDVYIYNEELEKTSNVELSENVKLKSRRLTDNSITQKTTIKSKYLINVYDYKDDIYYAYAAVLKMEKQFENKDPDLLEEDIRESASVSDETSVAEFSFDKTGKIISFKINQKMNDSVATYLYEFIEKVVPEVSKSSFVKTEDESREYKDGKIYHNKNLSPIKNNTDNEENLSWEVKVEKGRVNNVIGQKNFVLSANNEHQIDLNFSYNNNANNFSDAVQNDTFANRESLLKKIKNDITSKITLEKEDNDPETTEKLLSLLNKLKFKKYKEESRRLQVIPRGLESLRNALETYEIDTYAMPVFFTYPLFRTHLLGAQIGLVVVVGFTPMEGKLFSSIVFDVNGERKTIFYNEKETNFHRIIDGIKNVTDVVYLQLLKQDDTLAPIMKEYENEIKKKLGQLSEDITDYPKIVNVFDEELNRILNVVNESTSNCYNAAHDAARDVTNYFADLLQSTDEGTHETIKKINEYSTQAINNFITSNKKNIKNLYDAWKEFYNSANPHLENKKELFSTTPNLVFDLGLYYNIKDEMRSILAIYQKFADNIEKTLNDEKTNFEVYVSNQFDNIVDEPLRKTEDIADNAQNNVSVIDAMNIYFKEYGNTIRTTMIDQINNLRKTLNTIMSKISTHISSIYNNKIDSEEYKGMVEDIQVKLNEIVNDQEVILAQLKAFNKFDINFTYYFDDIILLNDLERDANEGKKKSYNTNIVNYLDGLSDDFLTEEVTQKIKEEIDNFYSKISSYLSKYEYTNALIESEKLSAFVKTINDEYFGEEFGKKVIDYYTNSNFINGLINQYYDGLNKAYAIFNTSFYETVYKEHRSIYVSKPRELMNKLLNISYALNPENSRLHQQIQTLIVSKIRLGISTSARKVYGMFLNGYNSLIQSLVYKKCCVNGYADANVALIEQNLLKFKEIYIDERDRFIPPYLYNPTNVEDEFKIKNIIIEKENEIRYNLRRIVDAINIDFINTFCYGNEIVCQYSDSVSAIEHYYYQASKLRVSLQFIQSIVTIAQQMIGNDILSNLDENRYTKLFEAELNYKGENILSDIIAFIKELNINTTKYINGSIETLKTDIKNYYISGVNEEGIVQNIKTIAKKIFVNPFKLNNETRFYLYYTCGPLPKIQLAFDEEIEYHKVLSEDNYYFDNNEYKTKFETALSNLISDYNNKKTHLFDYLTVPEEIKAKLIQKIIDFISNSYEIIYEKVNSISNITHFEFLGFEYSVREIILEVLHNTRENLMKNVNKQIEETYKLYLDEFKDDLIKGLDEQFKIIEAALNAQYTTTNNFYQTHSKDDTSLYKIEFRDFTISQLNTIMDIFFLKVQDIYSQEAVKEALNDAQGEALVQYPFNANYENFSEAINEDLIQLSQLTYKRFISEKTIFQANVEGFYIEAFKKIFIQFVNDNGKDYLDEIVDSDYEKKIYPDFSLMNSEILDTYHIVNTLINTPELKGLGYNLVKSFIDTFPEIKSKVKSIIPGKVETVVYPKIDLFKKNARNKIVDLFVTSIEEENKKIETKLSSKIYELIPKHFDSTFKAIVANVFNENIESMIQSTKQLYKNKVSSDLDLLVQNIEKYGNDITRPLALTGITIQDREWTLMKSYYIDLYYAVHSYNDAYKFQVSNERKEYIDNFYTNIIVPNIITISEGFEYQKEYGQRNLSDALSTFTLNSLIEKSITEYKASNMKSKVISTQSSLYLLVENLKNKIIEKFKNFPTELETKCQYFKFEGFDKPSYSERLRQLDDYKLQDIELVFDEIEKKYNKMKNNILTDQNYYNVETRKSGFINTSVNSVGTLTKDFYAYKVLIAQYTNNIKISEYFGLLESDAENIAKYVTNYVFDVSGEIDYAINSLYNGLRESWQLIREEINPYLTQGLDQVFKSKFQSLTNLKEEFPINSDFKLDLLTIEIVDSNREILNTIDIDVNIVDGYFGYSLEKINDYDFKMDSYVRCAVDLVAKTYVRLGVIETIEKRIADGKIGITSDYILHDKSVNADGYADIKAVNYNVIGRNIEDWDEVLYNVPKYVNRTVLHNEKKYRSIKYDL